MPRASSWIIGLCALAAFTPSCQNPAPRPAREGSCKYIADGYGDAGTVAVRVEKLVSGLEVPWAIAFLPDGGLLVAERPGRIRLVRQGRLLPQPVASVGVSEMGESGLLGMVLDPQFASNRQLYVYLTIIKQGEPVNRVERYRVSADGTSATRDRVILDDIPAAQFHSGGRLRFGPDGMLYVGTGDARKPELSQNRDSPAGKILRIKSDGTIPEDNPWKGLPAFLMGIRNTEGFDWLDSSTLIIADHGPSGELDRSGGDEVSVAKAGSNLGWPTVWGCEERTDMVTPVIAWKQAVPPGGAALYKGDSIPEWKGNLIIGTLGSRHLHRLVLDPQTRQVTRNEVYFQGDPPAGFGRLREVIMGPDGELYVTTSNCDGRGECPAEKDAILRIVKDGTLRTP